MLKLRERHFVTARYRLRLQGLTAHCVEYAKWKSLTPGLREPVADPPHYLNTAHC